MIHQGLKQRWSAHPRRNSIVAVVAVLVVVVAGFGVTRAIGGDSSAATTRNVEVTSGALQETVSGSGTIAAASTLEKDLGVVGKNNVEASAKVGAAIAERAKKAGVEECYFDRGGFLFHGKIKALADAAHEGGLKF